MADYVPQIEADTVDRIVQRDFASEVVEQVQAVLQLYGDKPHHHERDRVYLGALKLANGDLTELERQIAVASTDFRDVIGPAEYPSQYSIGFVGMKNPGPAGIRELQEQDWQDYSDWLNAS